MFLVGIELVKFTGDVSSDSDLAVLAVTVIVSLAVNMAFGFLIGIAVHNVYRFILKYKA